MLCLSFCFLAHPAQIIPRAIDYFTGKALEYDMEMMDDEEGFDGFDEDEDDGFDDDDDDDV